MCLGWNKMTATNTSDPWVVFDYESDMFFGLCELLSDDNPNYADLPHRVKNAIVESTLLHARQLVDILLSRGRQNDDINLSGLLPEFSESSVAQLSSFYGDRQTHGSPCWTLNKRLAHATAQRGSDYDYSLLLDQLRPILANLVQEVNEQRGSH